jgi:hypothetical protein
MAWTAGDDPSFVRAAVTRPTDVKRWFAIASLGIREPTDQTSHSDPK